MRFKLTTNFFGYLKANIFVDKDLLNSFGEIGVRDIRLNFKTSGKNIYTPWKPLELSTIKRRRRKSDKPLVNTGQLQGSVSKLVSGKDVYITTNRESKNGVNIAGVHNFGSTKRNIPAREFMKFSKFAIDEMIYLAKKRA